MLTPSPTCHAESAWLVDIVSWPSTWRRDEGGTKGGVGTGSWVGVGEIEIVARSSRDRGAERRCDGRGGVCGGVARQADGGHGGEAVGTDSMSSGLTPVSSHTPASSAAWIGAGVGAG